MKKLLSTTLFTLILFVFTAQTEQTKFVQFVFTNLETWEKAKEIDAFIRNQPGVQMSRSDNASKKYLIVYDDSKGITKEQIDLWMLQLGMTYKCYRTGTQGVDKIIHQTTDCE
jgi:hypothetical protein